MIYRFIGRESEIDGFPKLERFGQRIDLPTEVAQPLIDRVKAGRSGTMLLTEEQYSALFSEEDTQRYGEPDSHNDAPVEFLAKRKRAWILAQTGTDPDGKGLTTHGERAQFAE